MRTLLAAILLVAAPQLGHAEAQDDFEKAALGFWQRIAEDPALRLDDEAIGKAFTACGDSRKLDALVRNGAVLNERALSRLPGHVAFLKPGRQLVRFDLAALKGMPITEVESVPVRANGDGWRLHAGRGSMLLMTSVRTAAGPNGPVTQMFMMDARGIYLRCPMGEPTGVPTNTTR